MLYGAEINELLAAWSQRIENKAYSQEYRDALGDCIYELKSLLDSAVEKELTAVQKGTPKLSVSHADKWYS